MVSGECNIVSPAKRNSSAEIKIRLSCVVSNHAEYFSLCSLDRVQLSRTSLQGGIKSHPTLPISKYLHSVTGVYVLV